MSHSNGPFFSIIIPVYNRAKLVKYAVESILAQTFSDYEIIAVDDGSTDESLNVLKSYIPHIIVKSQANKGPGAARNSAIKSAKGKYLAFLDSDDLWMPWTLEVFHKVLTTNKMPCFMGTELVYFYREQEIINISQEEISCRKYSCYYEAASDGVYLGTPQMIIRADRCVEVGLFTEENVNLEDHDMCFKLGLEENFILLQKPCAVAYRVQDDSVKSNCEKNYKGACLILQQEANNVYPGGKQLSLIRLWCITSHVRSVSIQCLKESNYVMACKLFFKSFQYHVSSLRIKYLCGFPVFLTIYFMHNSFKTLIGKMITK